MGESMEVQLEKLRIILNEADPIVKAFQVTERTVIVYTTELKPDVLTKLNIAISEVFGIEDGLFDMTATMTPMSSIVIADYYVQRYIETI